MESGQISSSLQTSKKSESNMCYKGPDKKLLLRIFFLLVFSKTVLNVMEGYISMWLKQPLQLRWCHSVSGKLIQSLITPTGYAPTDTLPASGPSNHYAVKAHLHLWGECFRTKQGFSPKQSLIPPINKAADCHNSSSFHQFPSISFYVTSLTDKPLALFIVLILMFIMLATWNVSRHKKSSAQFRVLYKLVFFFLTLSKLKISLFVY